MNTKRIVIATIGTLGDLHPSLALGLELKRVGHHVTIASSPFYRPKVEDLGLAFHAIRPHWDDRELVRRCNNTRRGPETLFRELLLPILRETYDDLLASAMQADLLISHEAVFATPLVAETLSLPWVSALLSPCSFYSAYDPSVQAFAPELIHLRKAGLAVNQGLIRFSRLVTRHWSEPVRKLRKELGLREDCDPLFIDKFSPHLVLGLFSSCLAKPQPDWPKQTVQTGFPLYDPESARSTSLPELDAFLAQGEPPVIFTLGSLFVHDLKDFAAASAEAAHLLKRRAILVLGSDCKVTASDDLLSVAYVPYSQLFCKAAAIVHHGGLGTVAHALRAGKPTLVVPFGWDQFDNAERIQRMGTGLHLPRKRYSPSTVASALERLLNEPFFAARAAQISAEIGNENGVVSARKAIQGLLDSTADSRPTPAYSSHRSA